MNTTVRAILVFRESVYRPHTVSRSLRIRNILLAMVEAYVNPNAADYNLENKHKYTLMPLWNENSNEECEVCVTHLKKRISFYLTSR
jgi:hypothetical protein